MSALRISPDLELPIEMVGESTAILAKKGAGKSNTAKVIVEEALDHGGVQVVVLDPIGHWWSLRAGADGKPGGGYPVAVFGGMHGDLPLEETAGKLLAQTVVESGQSVVLDVSGLDSNGAMQRFVYELLEELYRLKQAHPTPLLLVLEEADEFAPQDPKGANVPRMVGAANRISKRGRGRGIGMLYVTQRSAALNKNVLDQSDTLIVMRTIGPRDRKAIEGWVAHQDAAGMEKVLPSLPSLETGEAWFWNPERGLLERVKVRKARTFDSSESPADRIRRGETLVEAVVKPIDVEELGQAIRATVERVKENDPAELRKRIRVLERQAASTEPERVVETVVERVEVPVLNGHVEDLSRAVAAMQDVAGNVITAGELVRVGAEAIASAITAWTTQEKTHARPQPTAARPAPARAPRDQRTPRPAIEHARRPGPREERDVRSEGTSASEQKILDGLIWLEALGIDEASRVQAAFLAGYKAGGGRFVNLLGGLNTAGLVYYPRPGTVSLTGAGRELARDPGLPRTNEAFHRAVLARLDGSQGKLLETLLDAYPDAITREDLGTATGYEAKGGRFVNLLGSLRSLGLIEYPQPGLVAALPVLFPEDS